MAKPKKLQRRPLRAASEPNESKGGSSHGGEDSSRERSAEPVSKLSVELPESYHVAIKSYCAAERIKIKDWILRKIAEATGKPL